MLALRPRCLQALGKPLEGLQEPPRAGQDEEVTGASPARLLGSLQPVPPPCRRGGVPTILCPGAIWGCHTAGCLARPARVPGLEACPHWSPRQTDGGSGCLRLQAWAE